MVTNKPLWLNFKWMLIALFFVLLVYISRCSAFIVYDPTNHIENAAIAANTANQLLNQAKMIEHQLEMLKTLSPDQWQQSQGVLSQLDDISKNSIALSQSVNELNQQFAKRYPNYTSEMLSSNESQSSSNSQTLDALKNAMQSLSANQQSITHERDLLHALQNQNQGTHNSVQAMQVANNLALENITQLQQLQSILAAQAEAQTAYEAQQASNKTYQAASLNAVAKHFPDEIPKYEEDPRFGDFKAFK